MVVIIVKLCSINVCVTLLCHVRQQLNEMTSCTMKIETLNGYLYLLELEKSELTTLTSGKH
jgi:hypothetical protein